MLYRPSLMASAVSGRVTSLWRKQTPRQYKELTGTVQGKGRDGKKPKPGRYTEFRRGLFSTPTILIYKFIPMLERKSKTYQLYNL